MRGFLSLLACSFQSLLLLTAAGALPNARSNTEGKVPYPQDWQIKDLFSGNQRFINEVNAEYPGLLEQTGKTQKPPFMFLGCVDSRASETAIFDAPPGTLFSARNIANQYLTSDTSAVSSVAYGVNHLNVTYIIVTGHYGCGGVSTAIASPSPDLEESIAEWVQPIRDLYASSKRPEIVELRTANAGKSNVPAPANDDPGFRALVEENVKLNVERLAAELCKSPSERKNPLQIYGFVYDIATGIVKDLDVTVKVEFTHTN